MRAFLLLIFLVFIASPDYEYQIDILIAHCNESYGPCCWEFCKVLLIPYEIKDSLNLPSFFRGNLIDGTSSTREDIIGLVWENNARDSSYIMVKYWSAKYPNNIKYKVFWFIK
jgi:hypothetical protein